MEEPSLHQVLSMENPMFKIAHKASAYHSVKGNPVEVFNITRWVEFNLQNIISAYGHVLSRRTSSLQQMNLKNTEVEEEICNVTELKHAAYRRLACISVPLVCEGAGILKESLSCPDTIRTGQDATLMSGKRSRPNWTFYVGQDPRIYLVTGTFRLSKAWSSAKIEHQATRGNEPIKQLARHATEAETRYGFILSETEVVVVCYYTTQQGKLDAKWQSVSRSACGQGVLTVNLAIWALSMMSLNSQHRGIAQEEYTVPLNSWFAQHGYYRNHLSGRVLSDPPTGGIIRD
ncbi:hypothetical protein FGADI_3782 [Fusarium gaditjirri]|uniref:Uncharacterized protein n=1 Tax=Fusarium gaditjirri TaxID=282569 RepID=A0A8H4TEI0_9HYPO|nr:hypothetical protein FGADI_3782 [Fusarium gaditjirri]